jgi:hypothetical protein
MKGQFGKFGVDGNSRRVRHDLLRLYRIRSRVGGGAGSKEPAARSAHRNPGLARHLHDALHRHGDRADRHHQLAHARRAQSRCRSRSARSKPEMACHADRYRRDGRPRLRRVRRALRPVAHLLFDGARRLSAAGLFSRAPRFKTPHRGTIITALFAAVLAAVFPLDVLADLVSIGTLARFRGGVRRHHDPAAQAPRARRQFRTPYVWLSAPAGIVICGVMMVSLGRRPGSGSSSGRPSELLIYFVYGVWHAAPSKWKVLNEP